MFLEEELKSLRHPERQKSNFAKISKADWKILNIKLWTGKLVQSINNYYSVITQLVQHSQHQLNTILVCCYSIRFSNDTKVFITMQENF